MGALFRIKLWVILAMACMSIFCLYLGKAYDDLPETGGGLGKEDEDLPQTGGGLGKADEDLPQTGGVAGDPAQIVAKALLCFNDRYIYSSCEESYRLTASGNLDVPFGYTDEYCNGPCLSETHLVLNCIEDIMLNFRFYNKATIQDIKDTVKAACSHGPERGNFNVEEHIEAEGSSAIKAATHILLSAWMIIGLIHLLFHV